MAAGPYDAGPYDAGPYDVGPFHSRPCDACQQAFAMNSALKNRWLQHQALITSEAACLHASENKVWQVQVTLNMLPAVNLSRQHKDIG